MRLLAFLINQFTSRGGRVTQARLTSLEELVGRYDVIVNCCGMGARELLKDERMVPLRGQIIRVRAPWIKMFYLAENNDGTYTYICPASDFVVVGGCKQEGVDDVTYSQSDHDAMWRRACEVMPSLRRATKLGDWMGVRPARTPLRVEAEVMRFPSGEVKVVHNYGHGSDGIALGYGTSAHAVRLVNQLLSGATAQSKL